MAVHQDKFADESKHTNQDRVDHFVSFNSDATDDINISHSNLSRRELEFLRPLHVAMARENRYELDDEERADAIFDEGLCDFADVSLKEAGLTETRIESKRIYALLLKEARGLNYEELADYISTYSSDELKQFGLDTAYGSSWYRKAANQLANADKYELLRDATYFAVNALFWNGVPIPEAVKERFDLSYTDGPDATDFPAARELALYSLVEEYLEIVVEQFSLGDVALTSQASRNVIGAFAHDVITGKSIERYDTTARHLFDLESAPHGSTIRKYIDADDLSINDIEEMFDDVYQALFERIIESGNLSGPILISYDRTDITNLEDEDSTDLFHTKDGRLQFYTLAATDPDLEFTYGLRLVKSQAERSSVLSNFLRDLTSQVDVRLYMADAEFDGVEDFDIPHRFLPGNWLLHAQDTSDSGAITDDYRRLREKIEPGKAAVVRNAGPANLAPRVKLIGNSQASEENATPDPIEAFYTDMELPSDPEDREARIEKIDFLYNQREKIESSFRLEKHGLSLTADTDKPVRKAFYFYMSVLFYNLYKIVNTIPAPNNGLELDATQAEVMQVLRNLAFGGPEPPAALEYLQDD